MPRATRHVGTALALAALAALAPLAGGALTTHAEALPATESFTLSVDAAGDGSGTVTSSPGGILCYPTAGARHGTCWGSYEGGTVVTLSATPASGSRFVGWSGACTGTATTCTITLAALVRVTASFATAPPPRSILSVDAAGSGSGTVTSSPGGIHCLPTSGQLRGTCWAEYATGTAVTLSATPAAGARFVGWTGACTGTGSTCTLSVGGLPRVTATFEFLPGATYTLSVDAAGDGSGSVVSTPAGITCYPTAGVERGTCWGSFGAGTAVTLTATPGPGSRFLQWAGACTGTSPTCTVTLVQATRTYAFFGRTEGTVTLNPRGWGRVSGSGFDCTVSDDVRSGTCTQRFAAGTRVTLTAIPYTNGTANWVYCPGVVTANVCEFTVAPGSAVGPTVGFTSPVHHVVSVGAAGDGSGTVRSDPFGINCRVTNGLPSDFCSDNFPDGATVTLIAEPAAGSHVVGWTGACTSQTNRCTLTVAQAAQATATFALGSAPSHVLSVGAAGTGSGTVTSSPAGVTCYVVGTTLGGTCWGSYPVGTVVTLTAAPDAGSRFLGWTGACSGAGACQVTMSQGTRVTASFVPASAGLVTLPPVERAAADLLGGRTLSAAERALLDRLGNADGAYDLGDLLALLDRTGHRLDAATLRRLRGRP